MSPWLVPQEAVAIDGDALRGYWQIKLRRVKLWIQELGDVAWTDPEFAAFSRELGRVAQPLNSSTSIVDVDLLNAVYDRALSLGFSSRTEQK